jgi:hypothetical protein
MGHQDPADAIRQAIEQGASACQAERRVTQDRRAHASNAATVIVVVGNGNFIAPNQSRATSPRRSAEFVKARANPRHEPGS